VSGSRERILAAWAALAAASRNRVLPDLTSIPDLTEGEERAAAAIHHAMLEAAVDGFTAVADEQNQKLSQARVDVALKLLGMIRGGDAPSEEDLRAARGLTGDELARAQHLWAEGVELAGPLDKAYAARLIYVAEHFPGLTMGQALGAMTEAQRQAYDELGEQR